MMRERAKMTKISIAIQGETLMRAFIRFNQGILAMPIHWKLWLGLLVGANLVAPLCFIERVEAKVVVGAFLVGMGLMTFLTARFGFSRILGLGHAVWIPLLAFLLPRCIDIPVGDSFGLWLRVLIVLNSASLVLDAIDVVRFMRGERGETVPAVESARGE
jgi:hypothetical protein